MILVLKVIMGRGLKPCHKVQISAARSRKLGTALNRIARFHVRFLSSFIFSSMAIVGIASRFFSERNEHRQCDERSNRIYTSCFNLNFKRFTKACCLSLFRFKKSDVISATAWKKPHYWNLVCGISLTSHFCTSEATCYTS